MSARSCRSSKCPCVGFGQVGGANLAESPKVSAYLPDSKYQGKPVHYSSETRGSKYEHTTTHHKESCVNQASRDACNDRSKCRWNDEHNKCGGKDVMGYCMKPLTVNTWGENNCKCVGIHNQPGSLEVPYGENGEAVGYPAGSGASCDAWI